MMKQKYGKIINISSTKGQGASDAEGFVNYAASKGGVNQVTKATARAGGPYCINVNAIAPSTIRTKSLEQHAATLGQTAEEFIKYKQSQSLLPHIGEPDDIANLALFLASDESKFITGQVINCDGGKADHL